MRFKENKITKEELKKRQNSSLEQKIELSLEKIKEFYEHNDGQVYVAFSGGKDSTVLLNLVRIRYPDVPAIYVNTGLEYPEINEFVKTIDNVITLRPEMNFREVIKTQGYPAVSKKVSQQVRILKNPKPENKATRNLYLTGIKKDGSINNYFKLSKKWRKLIDAPFDVSEKCCNIMKKKPVHIFEKETGLSGFVGTMASDSSMRKASYMSTGCNNYKKGQSTPIAFWLESDVWDYLKTYKIKYSSIYDKGLDRTGCMFCMFGAHLEKEPNRFQVMKKIHPELHDYCMNNLGCKQVCDFIGVKTE